jgi:hypothetical protein
MFAQTVIRALSRLGLDQRGTDAHPRQPAPMLLQKSDALFSSADWIYGVEAGQVLDSLSPKALPISNDAEG